MQLDFAVFLLMISVADPGFSKRWQLAAPNLGFKLFRCQQSLLIIFSGRQVPIFPIFLGILLFFPIFIFSSFLLFFSHFTFSDCQLKIFFFRISVEMYLYIDFTLLPG